MAKLSKLILVTSLSLIVLFVSLIVSPNIASAQTSLSWTTKQSMTNTRNAFGAATYSDKVYVTGGYNGSFLNSTEEYNPSTNAWTSKASMPTARNNLVFVTSGTLIYAIGGYNSGMKSENEAYNPSTNSWSSRTSMPTARAGHGAAVGSDGKIYVAGGQNSSGTDLTLLEVYNPSTDTWTTKASMSVARAGVSLVSTANGKIYAIGGSNGTGVLTTVEEYDIASNTWTTRSSMNTARWYFGATTGEDGNIYAIGGITSTTIIAEVEVYNPLTDTWNVNTSLSAPRGGLTAAKISSGEIYALGGSDNNGTYYSVVEEADVSVTAPSNGTLSWTTKQSMGTTRNAFGAAGYNGKVYVTGGYNGSFLSSTEEYNPSTNSWTSKANMTTARNNLAFVNVGDKIYAIGGYNSGMKSENEEYTPSTNTWATKTSMPTARAGIAAAKGSDGKIYVAGGQNSSGTDLGLLEVYDPASNSWATKASMNTARAGLALVGSANGKIYAIGGSNGTGVLTTVEEYDIASNTWTTKASMNTARWYLGAILGIDGHIYAIGGITSTSVTPIVEVYNPTSNSWSTNTSINSSRGGLSAATLTNGKIYALAGSNNAGTYYSTVEEATVKVAPVVNTLTSSTYLIAVNQTANLSALFSDANTHETHSATWDWGDNATTSGTVTESNGSGSVTGSHTYTTPGIYIVTLTVTDSNGMTANNTSLPITVYDNTTNHVAGNGSINSPAGAWADDTSFVGVARFNFQFKYSGNPPSPSGNTNFRLEAGQMRFDSTSYSSLSVSGTWAQYSGTGTVNGTSGYSFMITMDDLNPDKFRMKIWNTSTGTVKYDNQWGAANNATLTQTINSGDIKVN